jgi:L-iditol 2-dehydrogenase
MSNGKPPENRAFSTDLFFLPGAIMEMKCVMVRQVGDFEITRTPLQNPLEDEVLIQVEVTGLCRTDLKLIRVGHRDLVLPRIPGEEVVGIIRKMGSAVEALSSQARVKEIDTSVAGFREGDRVYVYPGVWCGNCPSCLAGAQNLCRSMRVMGFHRDGGFAEYVIAPAKSLIAVSPQLNAEQAVFAEPLSCCLNALELGDVGTGKTVGVWGAGPAGTLLHRAAKALGARPFNIDPDRRRAELIHGATSCPDTYFDVCIVAVGSKSAYEAAITRLNPRGRLVVFSGLSPADDQLPVSFNQLHYNEQTLVGAYGCSYRHGVQALSLIADGRVAVDDMISHRMPLDDLGAALEMVENRRGMKILLYP